MMFFKPTTPHKKQRPLPAFNSAVLFESLEPRLLLSGTQFEVNTLTDISDPNDTLLTLREAIEAANTNTAQGNIPAGSPDFTDIITFNQPALQQEAGLNQPLTITLNGTQLQITESLTITGLGQDILTINANQLSRVLQISGEQNNVQIEAVTITGGFAEYPSGFKGGGIYNTGNLWLSHATISFNQAPSSSNSHGGGIYNQTGTLTLNNSSVTNNSLTGSRSGHGGGIYNLNGDIFLINSDISDNSSSDGNGAGIYSTNGNLSLTDSIVKNNIANDFGGGIYFTATDPQDILNLTRTTVTNNSSLDEYGGGIYAESGQVSLIDSTILANSSRYSGGGLYLGEQGDASLIRTAITGNVGTAGAGIYNRGKTLITDSNISSNSGSSGGGIYSPGELVVIGSYIGHNNAASIGGGIYASSPTIINTTIANNYALKDGGGIYTDGNNTLLTNSTIKDNSAGSEGGGIYIRNYYLNETTINNSIVTRNESAYFNDIRGDYVASFSLIGLPTSVNPNYAVNLGSNALAIDHNGVPLNTDQNGQPRIMHDRVDVGATEFQGSLPQALEPSSTWVTTHEDTINATDGVTSLREAIIHSESLNQDISFAPDLAGKTLALQGAVIRIAHNVVIDASSIGGFTLDAQEVSGVLLIGNNSNVTLTMLNLSNGSAYSGSGIFMNKSILTLNDSTIYSNTSEIIGGGIYAKDSILILNRTSVYNNDITASDDYSTGGGIHAKRTTVTLNHSTIINNTSQGSGGGIYSDYHLSIVQSIISGNQSNSHGGGIFHKSGQLTITNSTVTSNTSVESAGGIYSTNTGSLNNTIVAFNQALINPDITTNLTNNSSLITTNPQFIRTPSSGDDDIWATADDDLGDLRLLPTSPAINAGDNTLLPLDTLDLDTDNDTTEPISLDLANNPRVNGGTVDIGAYESQLPPHARINVQLAGTHGLASSHDFGTLIIGQTATESFTINNTGNLPLIISDAADLAAPFTVTPSNNAGETDDWTIDPGQTQQFSVTYTPTTAGPINQTLTLLSNAIYHPTYNINFQANAVDPTKTIDVEINQTLNIHQYDFGTPIVDTAPISTDLIIHNQGNTNLTINEATGLSTDFQITPTNTAQSFDDWIISPGQSQQITVTFTPRTLGIANQTLTLFSDDLDQPTYTINFLANVVSPAKTIDVELNQTPSLHNYDFGTYDIYDLSPPPSVHLAIRNQGDLDLTVNQLAGLSADFQINPANTAQSFDDWIISPGQSQQITVTYTPTTIGPVNQTLTLFSDDTSQPAYTINFTAQAIQHPPLIVTSLLDVVAQDNLVTLREAILAANTNTVINNDLNPGSATKLDRIQFAPSLFANGPATLTLNGTQLDITDNLVIQGPAAHLLTINANQQSRIFNISTNDPEVSISNLTLTGGSGVTTGGAINLTAGTLTLTNTHLTNNHSLAAGGAIYLNSTLNLTNSLITGNTALSSRGSRGGGIYNANGILTITNSTIAANTSNVGGGIYTSGSSAVAILNNSIVTLNHADDSTFDTSGPLTNNNSLISTDPLFIANPTPGNDLTWGTGDDTLGDLHLQPNSPAINAGNTSLLPLDATDFDLSLAPRVNGGTVDIGAYESQLYNTADFNLDHQVNIADLIQWAQNFGQTTSTSTPATLFTKGDANLDNKINIADLIQWAQNFGQTSTPPPPPPPSITAPLAQTSNAIAIADTTSNSFLLNTTRNDPWANIKNLINPTTANSQGHEDVDSDAEINIIQNITSPI